MWVGVPQYTGNAEQNKRWRKRGFELSAWLIWDTGLLSSDWDVQYWFSWFSGLQTQTELTPEGVPGSWTCRWQIMEFLSFHNCMSQLLTINHFLPLSLSPSPHHWLCFSGEPQSTYLLNCQTIKFKRLATSSIGEDVEQPELSGIVGRSHFGKRSGSSL